jgi:class 3 adenylate cyclase
MAGERAQGDGGSAGIDDMLAEQARLDSLIREKFNRVLAVMFTDLRGSTTIAETEGDVAARKLIKEHHDIVSGAIRDHQGVFVKSIGDGTLSYFEQTQDALRAAVGIQKGIDSLNLSQKFKTLALVRIGIHSGPCLLENNDLFGDTINTASRFESSANPGEILLSEEAYNALSDKGEIYCRFDRTISLKGKKHAHDAYRAFWNPEEIERDRNRPAEQEAPRKPASPLTIALFIVVPLIIVLLLALKGPVTKWLQQPQETRTLQDSSSEPE